MEGHDEGRMFSVLGEEFNPNFNIYITLTIINLAEFTHFASFRKTQVFDSLHILLNVQPFQFSFQRINRILIWKQIRNGKLICVPLIPVSVNHSFLLKCDFRAMLQRVPEILQIGPYLCLAFNP